MSKKKLMTLVSLCFAISFFSLTLEEAKKIGLKNNLYLQNSFKEIEIADWQKKKAYANYLPQIESSWNSRRLNKINSKKFGFSMTQPIFSGGKLFSEIKVAKNNELKSKIEAKNFENQLLGQIEALYFEALKHQTLLELANQNLDAAKEKEENAKIRFDSGCFSMSDYLLFKIELAKKENELLEIQNNSRLSLENLKNVLNVNEIKIEKISENEILERVKKVSEINLQKMAYVIAKDAETNNLDLQISEIELVNRKIDLIQSKLSFLPEISLNFSKEWSKDENQSKYSKDQFLGINFALPIFPLLDKGADFIEKKRELEIAENLLSLQKSYLETEILNALSSLVACAKKQEKLQKTLEYAALITEERATKFQTGIISTIDFIDSAISLEKAKLDFSVNLHEFLQKESQLNMLVSTNICVEILSTMEEK